MNILTLNIKCFTSHITKCQRMLLPTEHNSYQRVYTSFHPILAQDKAYVMAGLSEIWNDYKNRLNKSVWDRWDIPETVLNWSGGICCDINILFNSNIYIRDELDFPL